MDPATLLGLVLILFGTFVGSLLKGVSPAAFFGVPAALLIVIVASFGAAFLSNTIDDVKGVGKIIMKAFKPGKVEDPNEAIDQIVSMAEKARREGLLSLEEEVAKIEDPFFKRGLQLAIDGGDPEAVENVMEAEVKAMSERHKNGAKFMTSIGIFAPTFGIIGAVIGLIATMSHLDDPEKLGAGIGAAFIATFWGVFMANGVFLPIGNKLTRLSQQEIAFKRMVIEGVLAIQSGANPRMLDDMLRSNLPPKLRAGSQEDRKSA